MVRPLIHKATSGDARAGAVALAPHSAGGAGGPRGRARQGHHEELQGPLPMRAVASLEVRDPLDLHLM